MSASPDLPYRSAICINPVGVIHSPYRERGDAPHQGRDSSVSSTIEIYPEYAPGLGTMEGITYIWVIYWMDRAERDLLVVRRKDW